MTVLGFEQRLAAMRRMETLLTKNLDGILNSANAKEEVEGLWKNTLYWMWVPIGRYTLAEATVSIPLGLQPRPNGVMVVDPDMEKAECCIRGMNNNLLALKVEVGPVAEWRDKDCRPKRRSEIDNLKSSSGFPDLPPDSPDRRGRTNTRRQHMDGPEGASSSSSGRKRQSSRSQSTGETKKQKDKTTPKDKTPQPEITPEKPKPAKKLEKVIYRVPAGPDEHVSVRAYTLWHKKQAGWGRDGGRRQDDQSRDSPSGSDGPQKPQKSYRDSLCAMLEKPVDNNVQTHSRVEEPVPARPSQEPTFKTTPPIKTTPPVKITPCPHTFRRGYYLKGKSKRFIDIPIKSQSCTDALNMENLRELCKTREFPADIYSPPPALNADQYKAKGFVVDGSLGCRGKPWNHDAKYDQKSSKGGNSQNLSNIRRHITQFHLRERWLWACPLVESREDRPWASTCDEWMSLVEWKAHMTKHLDAYNEAPYVYKGCALPKDLSLFYRGNLDIAPKS